MKKSIYGLFVILIIGCNGSEVQKLPINETPVNPQNNERVLPLYKEDYPVTNYSLLIEPEIFGQSITHDHHLMHTYLHLDTIKYSRINMTYEFFEGKQKNRGLVAELFNPDNDTIFAGYFEIIDDRLIGTTILPLQIRNVMISEVLVSKGTDSTYYFINRRFEPQVNLDSIQDMFVGIDFNGHRDTIFTIKNTKFR